MLLKRACIVAVLVAAFGAGNVPAQDAAPAAAKPAGAVKAGTSAEPLRVVLCGYRNLEADKDSWEFLEALRKNLNGTRGLRIEPGAASGDIQINFSAASPTPPIEVQIEVVGTRSHQRFCQLFVAKDGLLAAVGQIADAVQAPIEYLRPLEQKLRSEQPVRQEPAQERAAPAGLPNSFILESVGGKKTRVAVVQIGATCYGDTWQRVLARTHAQPVRREEYEPVLKQRGLKLEDLRTPDKMPLAWELLSASTMVVVQDLGLAVHRVTVFNTKVAQEMHTETLKDLFQTEPKAMTRIVGGLFPAGNLAAAAKAPQPGGARLALIPLNNVPAEITAQLEAALSADLSLRLVERTEIDKVLAEQKLALSGLADPSKAIQVGRILKADVLLLAERGILKGEKESAFCTFRAVEVRTGVILQSAGFPEEELAVNVSPAAQFTESALKKWQSGVQGRKYVGILEFYSEQPGNVLTGTPEALMWLLVERLAAAPKVQVLERDQLGRLRTEQNLSGEELAIKNSAILLEAGVRQEGDDYAMTFKLRGLGGGPETAFVVKVSASDPRQAQAKLAAAVLDKLGAAGEVPASLGGGLEASVFLDQARKRLAVARLDEARRAAEIALALDPSRTTRLEVIRLFDDLIRTGLQQGSWGSAREGLEFAPQILRVGIRQSELERDERHFLMSERKTDPSELVRGSEVLSPALFVHQGGINVRFEASRTPAGKKLWQQFAALQREAYADLVAYSAEKARIERNPAVVRSAQRAILTSAKHWCSDPAEWRTVLQGALAELAKPLDLSTAVPGWSSAWPDQDIADTIAALRECQTRGAGPRTLPIIPVQFDKPGADKVENEIYEWMLQQKDPRFRIAALESLTWLRNNYGYSMKLLDTFIAEVKPGSPAFWQCMAADGPIEGAFEAILANAKVFSEYCRRIFLPLMTRENAAVFARIETDKFQMWMSYIQAEGDTERVSAFIQLGDLICRSQGRPMNQYVAMRGQPGMREPELQQRANIMSEFPELEIQRNVPEMDPAWEKFELKQIAMEGAPKGGRCFFAVHGETLFALWLVGDTLTLYSVPLSGGKLTPLGAVKSDTAHDISYGIYSSIMAMAFEGDTVYAAFNTGVLARFSGGKGRLWNAKEGLGANRILCAAAYGGKVYLGTGLSWYEDDQEIPGTLVEFDPETSKSRVIASGLTNPPRCPLDGGPCVGIGGLAADPQRKCLWIGVGSSQNINPEGRKKCGIWRYDPRTGELTLATKDPGGVRWMYLVNGILYILDTRVYNAQNLAFNPETGKSTGLPKPFNILPNMDDTFLTIGRAGDRQVVWSRHDTIWLVRPRMAGGAQDGWVPCDAGSKQLGKENEEKLKKVAEIAERRKAETATMKQTPELRAETAMLKKRIEEFEQIARAAQRANDATPEGREEKRSRFRELLRDGRIDKVKEMIQKYPDVFARPKTPESGVFLECAAECDRGTQSLEFLLSQGYDVNETGTNGGTALHTAANQWGDNYTQKVKFLLDRGANPNLKDNDGCTPLLLAAWKPQGLDRYTVCEALLAKGSDVNASNQADETALYRVAYGDPRFIKLMLAHKANVNALCTGRRTPLGQAAEYGSTENVKLLLAAGADINAESIDGETPLSLAILGKQKGNAQLLISAGPDPKAACSGRIIARAIQNGYLDIARALIEAGADLNVRERGLNWQDPRKNSMLYYAAANGTQELVQLMLAKGANPNARFADEIPPLQGAIEQGKWDAAKLLLEKGARTGWKDKDGFTPLHLAARAGGKDGVDLLAARKADLNARGQGGATPLHVAAQNGKLDAAAALLAAGAKIDLKDDAGRTPLYVAAFWGQDKVVELLASKGADVNTKDRDGDTALLIASQRGNQAVVDVLKKHGAGK